MIRFKLGRGGLRVAFGAVVAAMCATSSAEAKIFDGGFCRAWREARQERCELVAFGGNQRGAGVDKTTILPAPAGSGDAAFYVVDGLKTPLFNGVDLSGWTSVEGGAPGEGWKVVDGTIFREKNGGDLYFDAAIAELAAATTTEAKKVALDKLQTLEQDLMYKVPMFTVGNAVFLSNNIKLPAGVVFCNPLYSCDIDFANWTLA